MPDLSRVVATNFRRNDGCRPENKNGPCPATTCGAGHATRAIEAQSCDNELELLVDHIARRAAVRGIPIRNMILKGECHAHGGSIYPSPRPIPHKPRDVRAPFSRTCPQSLSSSWHTHHWKSARFSRLSMVLPVWIEHTTTPLPRVCRDDHGARSARRCCVFGHFLMLGTS